MIFPVVIVVTLLLGTSSGMKATSYALAQSEIQVGKENSISTLAEIKD